MPSKAEWIPEGRCECVVKTRAPGEQQRDWLKRWMCMFHWQQTDYYQAKLDNLKDSLGR